MPGDERDDERGDERDDEQKASTDKTEAAPAAEEEQLLAEWRVHLFMRDVRKSVVATAACVLALALVSLAFGSAWFTVLGALILFGSLADLFLPITYRLTTRGAFYNNVVFRKRMAWGDVRGTYVSDFGVKLSPFSRPTRREAFRGIVLRFSSLDERVPGNREQVIRIVKERATKRR